MPDGAPPRSACSWPLRPARTLTLALALGLAAAWLVPGPPGSIQAADLGLCPFCGFHNPGQEDGRFWRPPGGEETARAVRPDRLCGKCLRPLRWPTAPARTGPAAVVVREGIDTFIRSWNDQVPPHEWDQDAGGDPVGPLGSWYELTGLRYLVWFDIPRAVAEAGLTMETFHPTRATLVLRVAPTPSSPVEVPIAAYLLTRPFVEGRGRWHEHVYWESGTTWQFAATSLPWEKAGGDYAAAPVATAILPATGPAEVYLDVSDLVARRFAEFRQSGTWFDPGFLLMRDPTLPHHCRYRLIYGFQSAPGRRPQRTPAVVRSPELYLE